MHLCTLSFWADEQLGPVVPYDGPGAHFLESVAASVKWSFAV